MSEVVTPVDRQAVAKLERVAGEAYIKYPKSCSHSVWYVIKQFLPDQPYMVANALIPALIQDKRWKETPLSEVAERASRGELIVGGATQDGNGHVVVALPGAEKFNGGFDITVGGKQIRARATGLYPLAMSTSIGSWPGAMSNGDKTVFDAWGKDAAFNKVKFWRLDTSSAP
jgi:hypothetical protein